MLKLRVRFQVILSVFCAPVCLSAGVEFIDRVIEE